MEKKILKLQLYSLFSLTFINLIYFYFRDGLPDNYYEISSLNESINPLSYYFFSTVANLSYWCGIWITLCFIVFSLIYSVFLVKYKSFKHGAVIIPLLPLTLFLSFVLFPQTLGDGLRLYLDENINPLTLFSSILFLSLSFLYLVSEKMFLAIFKFVFKKIVTLLELLRNGNFKIDFHTLLKSLSFKKSLKLFRSASTSKIRASSSLPVGVIQMERNLKKENFFRDELNEMMDAKHSLGINNLGNQLKKSAPSSAESEDNFFEDSVIDNHIKDQKVVMKYQDDDELASAPPPETLRQNEIFFESDELIDCIVPKNLSHSSHDPENEYFESIAKTIEEKLKEFNISATIINVLKGPVVDTFELDLGAGVRVNAVTNRVDDLSLALKGSPIRMVYPMKGKTTIGIEVPRNPRDLIYLDEVLKSKSFKDSSYRLPISMGKDAYGDAAIIDLASTPHLLVAGTTGAGKSVFVNTMLVSLIIKLPPKKLRLIMIDPKQLELALYQKLPHLIMPVVTDHSIASAALLWAIDEMERRYSILKDFAVKNIEGFNKKMKVAGPELTFKINKYYPDAEIQDFELPYIVIVVDEFADLKLSKSGPQIENSISRLAAKARASGIHIVLATQRPSTDVITGVIKANFPTRVAFRVTTNMDSRVIMDTPGAEKLLGRGDMLFKQGIETLRMHSAFVEEDEIENLVEKLSTLPVQYDVAAMEFIETNGSVDTDVDGITMDTETGGLKDEKYEDAVNCVSMHRVASASFLQRRLGVGYNRAANLIEEMERHGIVGPAQGSKPRKVLVPPPNDSTP